MACSAATAASSINAATLSSSPHFIFSCFFPNKSIFAASGLPGNLPFPRNHRFGSSALCFSRRQKHGSSPSQRAKPPQRKKKKQISPKSQGSEEDELYEDAFEALFKQLEEDLKNDDLSFDDIEDDISEEDLAKLEQELAEALGDDELQMSISNAEVTEHDDDAEAGDDTAEHHDDDDEEEEEEEEDIERPAEALFKQLEEDLKNDDPSFDDIEDDISEEDLARLERELAEALADDELQMSLSNAEATEDDGDDDDDDDDEDIERPVELKRWQLRRLATALKTGRRKTSIKNLAAELCLERAVVLELLRDPPPNLLMMSAMLPDEALESEVVPENRTVEVATPRAVPEAKEHNTPPKVKVPLHVMHQTWSSQKRLKKAQVQTLERVYRRTKRPTNAMISSIVHVTSLPRKRIIKWFEDKRAKDGVPDQRLPYERPVPDTVG